jgi:hypothetical protein
MCCKQRRLEHLQLRRGGFTDPDPYRQISNRCSERSESKKKSPTGADAHSYAVYSCRTSAAWVTRRDADKLNQNFLSTCRPKFPSVLTVLYVYTAYSTSLYTESAVFSAETKSSINANTLTIERRSRPIVGVDHGRSEHCSLELNDCLINSECVSSFREDSLDLPFLCSSQHILHLHAAA